jgi:hypothetical protein
MDLIQVIPKDSNDLKIDLVDTLLMLFRLYPNLKNNFRINGGFSLIISILINIKWDESIRNLIEKIFTLISLLISNNRTNRENILDLIGILYKIKIGPNSLIEYFKINNLLEIDDLIFQIQLFLDLSTERSLNTYFKKDFESVVIGKFLLPKGELIIKNQFSIIMIMKLLKYIKKSDENKNVVANILQIFLEMTSEKKYLNLEIFSNLNLFKYLIKHFENEIFDKNHENNTILFQMIENISSYRMSVFEWKLFFNVLNKYKNPLRFLTMISKIIKNGDSTHSYYIDHNSHISLSNLNYDLSQNLTGIFFLLN